MNLETESLVKKARLGNDEAFYELIQRRKELLYRTAYAYVKNRDDALDIVSDTVYKAYRSLRKLKEPAFFNTWLTRILINCSLDHLRRRKRAIPLKELAGIPGQTKDFSEELDLHRAIDKLDHRCRTVIILKYLHDLTIREVAEIMQCPQGTVKTYLHKALNSLRIELKEDWPE
ncbi:MAG TPA: sigma-70 family RNA polymerase sigma factor [Bacillota bacterium]|nr:sigma-70 family RNA polymerase sigma factor [Bacillota bacterium]